jgi:hypothetical protein
MGALFFCRFLLLSMPLFRCVQVSGLASEVNILGRLLHRSINQHRSSKHLARIRQLRRLVKQTISLGMDKILTRTSLLCVSMMLDVYACNIILAAQSRLQRSGSSGGVSSMPSQHLLCYVMLKLLSFYSLGIRLQQHCMACTAPLAQLISQTYFMPFALTANAIVARIFAVTSDMLPSIERAWTLMTVALARAPHHSSPPPESVVLLSHALPALSAQLANVHESAFLQLQNMFPLHSSSSSSNDAAASDFPMAFQPDSLVNDANTSTAPIAAFKLHDGDSGTGVSLPDDMGIPIGSSKKSMPSKVLRRQTRPLEYDFGTSSSLSSLKKIQGAVGSEFHRSNSVPILKPPARQAILKERGQAPFTADDIFSALRGIKK